MKSKQQQSEDIVDGSTHKKSSKGTSKSSGGKGNVENSAIIEELRAYGMKKLLSPQQVEASIPYNEERYDVVELNHLQKVCSDERMATVKNVDELFVEAVANYQKESVLGVDGKVGKKTYGHIMLVEPGSSDISDNTDVEIWFLKSGMKKVRSLLSNSQLHNVPTLDNEAQECVGTNVWTQNRQNLREQNQILRENTRLTAEHIEYIIDYQKIFGLPETGIIDEALKRNINMMYKELVKKSGYTVNEQHKDEKKVNEEMSESIEMAKESSDTFIQIANTTWKKNIPAARKALRLEKMKTGKNAEYDAVDFHSMLRLQERHLIPISGIPDDETMTFLNQLLVRNIPDPEGNIKGDSANDNVKVEKYIKKRIIGSLFVNGISYSDVEQNALGDCWWLAALASVAKNDPKSIEDMFTDNGDGTFGVHLYAPGMFGATRKTYRLDTDFWFTAEGTPAFAGYGDLEKGYRNAWGRELWVMLAEKALAMHTEHYRSEIWQLTEGVSGDSYANTEGGWSYMGLEIITGKTSSLVYIDPKEAGEKDRVWQELQEALTNNENICASSGGKEPTPPAVPVSLMMSVNGLPDITDHLNSWSSQWGYNANVPAATSEYMRLIEEENRLLKEAWAPEWWCHSYKEALQDFEQDFHYFMQAKMDNTVTGHAWSILDAFEASDIRYVKIFNPWRSTQANSEGLNDGVFVLTLDEFIQRYKYFSRAG